MSGASIADIVTSPQRSIDRREENPSAPSGNKRRYVPRQTQSTLIFRTKSPISCRHIHTRPAMYLFRRLCRLGNGARGPISNFNIQPSPRNRLPLHRRPKLADLLRSIQEPRPVFLTSLLPRTALNEESVMAPPIPGNFSWKSLTQPVKTGDPRPRWPRTLPASPRTLADPGPAAGKKPRVWERKLPQGSPAMIASGRGVDIHPHE